MNFVAASPTPAVQCRLACRIVQSFEDALNLRANWDDLLARSARPEIVLTPDWLLTWWRVYGSQDGRQLRLGVFTNGDRLVGLAPLLVRRHWYRPGIPFRRLEFLATGERAADAVCSEYVNVIAERGAEAAVADAFVAALVAGDFGPWDEVVLAMMDGETPLPSLLHSAFRHAGLQSEIATTGHAPYIPLPSTWDAYLAALSKSNRTLVRDSVRRFEKWAGADGCLHRATTPDEVEACKKILIALHHQRWQGVEQAGVFRSPHFLHFHDEILPILLRQNALDLLHMTDSDGEPVAAAYNLVRNGKVSFYQSGRKLDVPKNIRPGIVLHAYAIRAAIKAGQREYDFLGGAARYKTQLALASRPIVQVRAVRSTLIETAHHCFELAVDRTRTFRNNVRAKFRGHRLASTGTEESLGGE